MRLPIPGRRLITLAAVLVPLLGLFVYMISRTGPLAPIPVTAIKVESRTLSPALFGIGTVEARYRYPIGPVLAGRVLRVDVQVGDRVRAGQVLGEMDPVDLGQRLAAQDAALRRAQSAIQAAEARIRDGEARRDFTLSQVHRYQALLEARTTSEDTVAAKRQEAQVAEAGLAAAQADLKSAREELARAGAEREALASQRANLRLLAPVDGLVVTRNAEPGSTLVAGQALVELIDPASLWVNVRFDQLRAAGLEEGLAVRVVLRSQPDTEMPGRVARVEPLADAVTEELLAKVTFDSLPTPLPRAGELAEARVALPALAPAPVLPNAAIHRVNRQLGVWRLEQDGVGFVTITTGASDLEGLVQVRGLEPGTEVALHSLRALAEHSRIRVVSRLPGDRR